MSTDQDPGFETFRDRIAKQGEDALGRFAQELLENPLVSGTLSKALDARERATQAQEVAMGALNLPSAADVERLTRRLRSVSQRLEGIEDAVDRLDAKLERASQAADRSAGDGGAPGVEAQLARLTSEISRLVGVVEPGGSPRGVSLEQERLAVDAPGAAKPPKAAKAAKPRTSEATKPKPKAARPASPRLGPS